MSCIIMSSYILFNKRSVAVVAIIVFLVFMLARASCHPVESKPTKEVNLSTELEIKQKPLQENIDQFFSDQEHLSGHKSNETAEGGGSWAMLPDNVGNFISQVMDMSVWSQILSQLGVPILDPTQFGIMFINAPVGRMSQMLNSGCLVANATRPLVLWNNLNN